MIIPAIILAFPDCTCPILGFKPTIIGKDPKISITAKSFNVTIRMFPKFII
tara:strand:+ start:403 stop:555 length:153 start_codon:yes stop_codon:yes gene_type:complete